MGIPRSTRHKRKLFVEEIMFIPLVRVKGCRTMTLRVQEQ